MEILIKGMDMPRGCDDCKLKSNGYCDITNRLIPYDGSRHGDCPLVEAPDEQPDRNAQERYEDLCEYFKDCHDKGMGILGDRKEFKAWLERVYWHVVRCDELGRELEKLQPAQPEQRWIPSAESVQNVPNEDLISRKTVIEALLRDRQQADALMDKYLKNGYMALRADAKAERNRIEKDIAIIEQLPPAQPDVSEALSILDAIRAGGRIKYSDYCELHDAIAEIGEEE